EQLKRLKKEMQDAISKEDFERAAALRDEIKTLESQTNQKEGE
ncbi:MAG: UvrB/UvrC motif-containing protein, partial [Clostridia bacterium]|nr:UvrB/UvrC motif-containing protein [Clostridia bacterium]